MLQLLRFFSESSEYEGALPLMPALVVLHDEDDGCSITDMVDGNFTRWEMNLVKRCSKHNCSHEYRSIPFKRELDEKNLLQKSLANDSMLYL